MNRRQAIASLLALPIAVKAVAAAEPLGPGFVSGSMGQFRGFAGPVKLHGTEAILRPGDALTFVSEWVPNHEALPFERLIQWPELKDWPDEP